MNGQQTIHPIHGVTAVSRLPRAALDGMPRVDGSKGGQEPLAAIDADHLELVAIEAAPKEIVQKDLPFGFAFRARQTEVDDLLLAVVA